MLVLRISLLGNGVLVSGAYIIGISKETNTGNNHSAHVVPSKWGFIDLSQSQASSLVWVLQAAVSVIFPPRIRMCPRRVLWGLTEM